MGKIAWEKDNPWAAAPILYKCYVKSTNKMSTIHMYNQYTLICQSVRLAMGCAYDKVTNIYAI